jgi:hypothetical protein
MIGLVPGIGDAITTLISLYIVREAASSARRHLVARMLANVAIDGVVGAVPFLGDAFDVMWRANRAIWRCCESISRPPMTARWSCRFPPPRQAGGRSPSQGGSWPGANSFGHLMSVDEEVWNAMPDLPASRAGPVRQRHDRRGGRSSAP